MRFLRRILFTITALLAAASAAQAGRPTTESLQKELSRTVDPRERIRLLLNLKDLNEDTNLNLPYSIRLFREAAAAGDTYAMSVAVVPIVSRYAAYAEKEDSLHYYIRTLRSMTPGTPQEGMDEYAEMNIAYQRMSNESNRERTLLLTDEVLRWCDSLDREPGSVYRRAKTRTARGYAQMLIDYYRNRKDKVYAQQIGVWEEAYALTRQMPDPGVRRSFADLIYFMLSGGYNQAYRYDDQKALTEEHIAMLDRHYARVRESGRRPYLYADNSYVRPYQQLILCASNIGRPDLERKHFEDFRSRMLAARGEDLMRNKTYLYELGYLWRGTARDNEQAILYSDSLVRLIESGQGYFRSNPHKIQRVYRDRSRLLYRTGNHAAAVESYRNTSRVQDSLLAAERTERIETIRQRQDMDRMKLSDTEEVIRNRTIALIAFVALGLLLLATGIYLRSTLRSNRKVQADILRLSRKAQESEHMKSTFVDTICRGVGPPLDALDRSTLQLMTAGIGAPECSELLVGIRDNTRILLSTLDNLLEAANLDSLTEDLLLVRTDVDEVCRAELLAASRMRPNPEVEYLIEAPGTQCIVATHAKYFSFVVRALLDNAGKYTLRGRVVLRYEVLPAAGELRVTVTDTGAGIPLEKRGRIFRPLDENTPASHGLSLALCRLIAEHLSGSIRLDETYVEGARFIFTIPARP